MAFHGVKEYCLGLETLGPGCSCSGNAMAGDNCAWIHYPSETRPVRPFSFCVGRASSPGRVIALSYYRIPLYRLQIGPRFTWFISFFACHFLVLILGWGRGARCLAALLRHISLRIWTREAKLLETSQGDPIIRQHVAVYYVHTIRNCGGGWQWLSGEAAFEKQEQQGRGMSHKRKTCIRKRGHWAGCIAPCMASTYTHCIQYTRLDQ